jgi:hypothetical protein
MDDLVKEKIRTFYERMNFELRSLERFKLKSGICIMGISCDRPVVEGTRGCVHHRMRAKMQREGTFTAPIEKFSTEYGRIRKQEIPLERAQQKKIVHKSPRRAARRAA